VRVDLRTEAGLVASVAASILPTPGDVVVDGAGGLCFAALAEPHAHLDKAFLAGRVVNRTGDLEGAITAMMEAHPDITTDDVAARAERAVRRMVANGVTAIRSHVDVTAANDLRGVEALVEVRRRVADLCTLQLVALVEWPVAGPEGAASRARATRAIEAGVDVLGGCPHLDTDARAANTALLDLAAELGVPLDLHCDETLDPHAQSLEHLAEEVLRRAHPRPVTASHCVSLGVQDDATQERVAARVAEAGIGVIALPHTNLFLQGRDHQRAMPRGLTAVRALRRAGATVAAGADNLQDPFNPVGRADPLETAALMVMTTHLLPDEALATVTAASRTVMSLPPAGPSVGSAADLVVVPASDVRAAIADQPADRIVVHAGRVVAGTDGATVVRR
jgi:cytosine deaminase